jgi:hypothetical protein
MEFSSSKRDWAWAIGSGVACVIILFWRFFVTSGDKLAGDDVDTRLCIYLCEHLRLSFLGKASLLDPAFFYPERGLMGRSEGMLLYSIPFSLFRTLGADIYYSFEATLWAIRLVGHLAAFYLLRRVIHCSLPVAIFGACLVSTGNVYFLVLGHTQLLAVSLVILIGALVAVYVRHRSLRPKLALSALLVSAILAGLLSATSFYVSLFSALLVVFTGLLFGVASLLKRQLSLPARPQEWAAAFVLAIVACYPTFWLYKPVLEKTSWRDMATTRLHMADAKTALDPRFVSDLWNLRLPYEMGDRQLGHRSEAPRTWPPLTLALASVGLIWAAIKLFQTQSATERFAAAFLLAAAGLYACCLVFPTANGEWTAWVWVRQWIPLVKAIRVPQRFAVVAHVAVALVIAIQMQKLYASRLQKLFFVLAAICLAEQVNWHEFQGLSRFGDLGRLGELPAPPQSCRVFAIDDFQVKTPAYQLDAMLLSQRWGIPTINGYTAFEPYDWNLQVDQAAYSGQLRRWALKKGLTNGFCVLNFESKNWTVADPQAFGRIPIDQEILFTLPGKQIPELLIAGFRGPTADGTWLDSGSPKLRFGWTKASSSAPLLNLKFDVRTLPANPVEARLEIDNQELAKFEFTKLGLQEVSIAIPTDLATADLRQMTIFLNSPGVYPPRDGQFSALLVSVRASLRRQSAAVPANSTKAQTPTNQSPARL